MTSELAPRLRVRGADLCPVGTVIRYYRGGTPPWIDAIVVECPHSDRRRPSIDAVWIRKFEQGRWRPTTWINNPDSIIEPHPCPDKVLASYTAWRLTGTVVAPG